MARVQVEFINTCAHCAETGRIIEKVVAGYGDDVELKQYVAGKDFDYLKKYGMISKGTIITEPPPALVGGGSVLFLSCEFRYGEP